MNPFIFDKHAIGDSFCGRSKETAILKERCIAGSNSLLYGRRRYGKSSLIKKVFQEIDGNEFLTVYVDLFDAKDELDVARLIYKSCANSISSYAKATHEVKNFFKKITLSMSVNAEGNVSFSPKLNDFTFDEYINDALDTIGMFAKQKGKKVVIAIDEFQQISTIDSPIDATLRKHLQEKMDFIWIFSGSKRHLLSELFVDQGKPLYKQAEGLEVKEINESELYEFASNHLTKSALSKDAFGLIYKISDGETKLIQQICNKLYTRRQLGDVGVIDVDTIHDVLNAILDGEDGVYRMIDGNLKPNQRKALRHLVRFSGVALLTHDKLKQTNISNSSLSRALGSLYDGVKGYGYIIDKEYDKYFIQDRTFEIWIYRIVFNRLPD